MTQGTKAQRRMEFRIEARVGIAAAVVVIDDLFKCPEAAVMHIGSGPAHFTQAGCLETAAPAAGVREDAVPPGDACGVQPLVGNCRTSVA